MRYALAAAALVLILALAANSAIAEETATAAEDAKAHIGSVTGLPLPRFVSLKSGRVNVRRGPGKDYPVEWVFEKRGLPVEITAEYDRWRRIKDREGDVGWVWHAMLDGRRTAIVLKPDPGKPLPALHAEADGKSPAIAYAEPGVIAELQSCEDSWCKVKVQTYRGWIERDRLWGTYPNENFD